MRPPKVMFFVLSLSGVHCSLGRSELIFVVRTSSISYPTKVEDPVVNTLSTTKVLPTEASKHIIQYHSLNQNMPIEKNLDGVRDQRQLYVFFQELSAN